MLGMRKEQAIFGGLALSRIGARLIRESNRHGGRSSFLLNPIV